MNSFVIDNVKIDIVAYPYPWLEGPKTIEDIRFAGIKDISAMKLAAITIRGTKKDFIDLNLLMQFLSLSEMLKAYKLKFTSASEFMVLRSLIYFDDAEQDASPILLKKVIWEEIKHKIIEQVGLIT